MFVPQKIFRLRQFWIQKFFLLKEKDQIRGCDVPEIEFLDTTFGPFKKDKKNELPIAAALFFVLKGSADFIL